MQAERYVDASFQHILSEPDITVPEGTENPFAWAQERNAFFCRSDDAALEKMVQTREPLWQFARLHQMARSSLIRNFGFQFDSNSGRLFLVIEPLSPMRHIALNVPGIPAKKTLKN